MISKVIIYTLCVSSLGPPAGTNLCVKKGLITLRKKDFIRKVITYYKLSCMEY